MLHIVECRTYFPSISSFQMIPAPCPHATGDHIIHFRVTIDHLSSSIDHYYTGTAITQNHMPHHTSEIVSGVCLSIRYIQT